MARLAMLILEFVWPSIAYQRFIYNPRTIAASTQAHTPLRLSLLSATYS